MLVNLQQNDTSGASSVNFSSTGVYSPSSVQLVMVKVADTGDSPKPVITVQIGSRTIVNGIRLQWLSAYTALVSNAPNTNNEGTCLIDLGSWQVLNNENLYVTVAGDGANNISSFSVCAIVDEPFAGSDQIQYTTFSDQAFTAPNVVTAVACTTSGDMTSYADLCQVKTASYSSAPSFLSGHIWFSNVSFNQEQEHAYALLSDNDIPMDTTFNYNNANVNSIVVKQIVPSGPANVTKASQVATEALNANTKTVVSQV